MTELPVGWAGSSLGEITALRGEKLDPATVPNASFIGLEDIEPHTSRILKTGQGSDVKSSVARFSAGDVLYSRLRPYLNKVTVPDFDGIASAEILVLQPTAAAEAEFVRRRLMTREFLDFAALLDKGDRPRVNFVEIAEFPVALPPFPEQGRIVAKVDGLTARTARARKELDRIPTLIAHYKQRLLALAFSGALTAGWRSTSVEPKPVRGRQARHIRSKFSSGANDGLGYQKLAIWIAANLVIDLAMIRNFSAVLIPSFKPGMFALQIEYSRNSSRPIANLGLGRAVFGQLERFA
jgi:hypothetical protein